MNPVDPCDYLKQMSYPGRGILLGVTPDSSTGIVAYFIMGRSENSRNRIFVPDGDGLRTEAYDPKKLTDPSLIIYSPVRVLGETTIVTNGDQTDTIAEYLDMGLTFEEALSTRTFEPDAPSYTPRISGVFRRFLGHGAYRLSILKAKGGDPAVCDRQYFVYEPAIPGTGHMIHTYSGAEDPLPSFEGAPVPVRIEDAYKDVDYAAETLWRCLDPENKVSLYLRACDLNNGGTTSKIINIHSAKK